MRPIFQSWLDWRKIKCIENNGWKSGKAKLWMTKGKGKNVIVSLNVILGVSRYFMGSDQLYKTSQHWTSISSSQSEMMCSCWDKELVQYIYHWCGEGIITEILLNPCINRIKNYNYGPQQRQLEAPLHRAKIGVENHWVELYSEELCGIFCRML